ncbi:MAG: TonB-dependent receptor, partial [Caulobacterales bacterium]|nr:TonB-dependent receptor [Caulobacterales bacterium]
NSFFDTVAHNVRLQGDLDVGEHTLTYVGGYSDLNDENIFDPDFSANPWLAGPADISAIQQSHEIRIQTPVDKRLHGVAGLYYYNLDYQLAQRANVFQPGRDPAQPEVFYELFPGGPLIPLPNPDYDAYLNGFGIATDRVTQFDQDTTAYAAFASVTFEATDFLRLTVGGRYTDEDKEADFFITNLGGTIRTPDGDIGPPPGLTPAVFGNSFDTTVTPFCRSDVEQPVYNEGVAQGSGDPCGPGLKRSESRFTPSVDLQWDVTPDIMTYFHYSEGFKGGGFNAQTRIPDFLEFEEETVDAYEIGVKSTLLDGAMTLNGAVFYSKYDNWQVTQFVNQVFIVGNAAEVTSQGVELDILWQATDKLRAGLSAGYTDATYDSFPDAACTNAQLMVLNPFTGERAACAQDLAGVSTPLSPDVTAALTLDYEIPLANLPFDAQIGTNISYSDEFLLSQQNDPEQFQDAYTLVNLRAGLFADNGRWELAFLGRNLGDEDFQISAGDVPAQNGAVFVTSDRGRTFEAQLNVYFN